MAMGPLQRGPRGGTYTVINGNKTYMSPAEYNARSEAEKGASAKTASGRARRAGVSPNEAAATHAESVGLSREERGKVNDALDSARRSGAEHPAVQRELLRLSPEQWRVFESANAAGVRHVGTPASIRLGREMAPEVVSQIIRGARPTATQRGAAGQAATGTRQRSTTRARGRPGATSTPTLATIRRDNPNTRGGNLTDAQLRREGWSLPGDE